MIQALIKRDTETFNEGAEVKVIGFINTQDGIHAVVVTPLTFDTVHLSNLQPLEEDSEDISE